MGTLDRRRFGVLRGLGLLLLLVAISAGPARAQAPEPTQGQTAAGSAVALEGEIEIIHEDFKNSGRYLYFLKTSAGKRLTLHFAKHPPTNLLTGDHVSVRGSQSGATIMLASGGNVTNLARTQPPPPSPTGPLPNTLGAQSTLVILVNFQDAPTNQPYTVADAQNLVFGTASSFFLENSYQQAWLTGNVVGWFTIPLSSTTCNITSIASYAQAAASAAGINLAAYTHYVYAFPQNNACGFGGSSFIGGSPSQSWINGTNGSGGMDVHVIDHELGHAFGLWHSHLLDCGTSATICSNGNIIEYGDIIDTMGAPQTSSPHYSAFQKERLGWLNYGTSPSITTVNTAGTYAIGAYEVAGSGPDALKILKSIDPTTGAKTWYYIEARQVLGFDAFLTNDQTENETNGVLVHVGTDGDGNSGDLLDMTPPTPSYYFWLDPSLIVGQSFSDPAAGVTISTDWVTSTQAAVDVQFSGGVTLATNQSSYIPGQTVSTSATATYAGAPIANVSVSFTLTKANGNVVSGSVNTGSNGIAVYKVRLMKSDPAGAYVAGAVATIKGNPHSASTKFTVQ
jgi:M6 family metalloprotease-like protein